MPQTPTVSLIIPCFNHADTLPRAVRSAQTQDGLAEIVIVDDRSSDTSLAVARQLAAEDGRIRVVQTEQNQGPGGARNTGFRATTGRHICFLDADDELLGTDFFPSAFDLMTATPGMRLVKAEMEFFDPIKGYILPSFDPRHTAAVLSSSCALIVPREVFLSVGGFPEDPVFRGPLGGEDVAFMEALMAHFQPIGRIPRPCYRVWSAAGSHVDRLLASTRLAGDSFEFVKIEADQAENGPLKQALARYLEAVADRLAAEGAPTTLS